MSGHSKWANIKHKKAKGDAAKGKIFTKIGREIAVAVKEGGSDPSSNSKLEACIAKARANNMPNDNIERSIKKAAGELGNVNYEDMVYEGYGAGGVAVIVEALTDNKNRTAGDVRHLFDKNGGSLGTTNCVSFMFDKKGVLVLEKTDSADEDEIMMLAIDAGADDVITEDDVFEIYTSPADLYKVKQNMENSGIKFLSCEVEMIPQKMVSPDEQTAAKINKLIESLEDLDDVQRVFHNAELPEEEDEE